MAAERKSKLVRVRVEPLPYWLDLERLLGPGFTRLSAEPESSAAEAELSASDAADVCARLRGLGLDGAALSVRVTPPLSRALVRSARLSEARARRDTTRPFLRPGARATGEGRYSLTPEAIARRLAADTQAKTVVDACCGSGGNALGFAASGAQVVAIDIDDARIEEARHNAALYGLSQRIRFVHGDARALLAELAADILFVDPPWGRDYDKRSTTRADLPLLDALLALPETARAGYRELWLKLPASFDTRSLPGATVRAFFGEAAGDYRRIKFILVTLPCAQPAL